MARNTEFVDVGLMDYLGRDARKNDATSKRRDPNENAFVPQQSKWPVQ